MFKPTKEKSVAGYIAALPKERKGDIRSLHAFIKGSVPKLKPHFAYNMLGYGSFPYVNYKKEKIGWPVIALASQKNYISVYVCAMKNGKYLAELHKKTLGKVSVGRSCIRFKRLDDVHLPTLRKVLKEAERHPALVGARSA